jgi:phosphatidylglycerophosphatase A
MKKWPPTTRLWQKWVGSVGGAGFLPVAPGTWGAAAGVVLLLPFLSCSGSQMLPGLAVATLLATFVGARAAHDLAPDWGEDPKPFVLDEVAGLWVAMLGWPITWPYLLAAFLLFRIFDIWKPLGIRRLEAVPNGWGVMLDDLAAGVASNVCIMLWYYFNLA